jgi:cysteine desulfurase
MSLPSIYLDHAATSPLRPEAREAFEACLGTADFNPASAHAFGRAAKDLLERARERIASELGAQRRDLLFTAGGTVADNLAVLGFARARGCAATRIIVSAVEHKAVLAAARQAEAEGARLFVLPVSPDGSVNPLDLEAALADCGTAPTLVSVMWANNEVGAIQPVAELCEIAHAHGACFHTDAVQAFGKLHISVEDVPADLVTITAHKIGGPVGIGGLLVRGGIDIAPLVFGGSQEGGRWPGTQNAPAAAAFAAAVAESLRERDAAALRWTSLRDTLEAELREGIEGLVVHAADASARLPQLLSVGVPGADAATLLMSLDLAGVAVSSGSACSSGSQSGSHVLAAMGIMPTGEYAVLRFSFGPSTSEREVLRAAGATVRAAEQARAAVRT